jgi:uncharacterized membrane protein YvbJ
MNTAKKLKRFFTPKEKVCPECGAELSKQAKICPECGHNYYKGRRRGRSIYKVFSLREEFCCGIVIIIGVLFTWLFMRSTIVQSLALVALILFLTIVLLIILFVGGAIYKFQKFFGF